MSVTLVERVVAPDVSVMLSPWSAPRGSPPGGQPPVSFVGRLAPSLGGEKPARGVDAGILAVVVQGGPEHALRPKLQAERDVLDEVPSLRGLSSLIARQLLMTRIGGVAGLRDPQGHVHTVGAQPLTIAGELTPHLGWVPEIRVHCENVEASPAALAAHGQNGLEEVGVVPASLGESSEEDL